MAQLGSPTAQATQGGPRTPLQNERQEQKRDLASWWRNFKRSDKKPQEIQVPQGIFGVPLPQSIRYANVAISLLNEEGQSYIYGYVPIVVAKCGVFLKEKATETEGIFRLAGSEKRIKELKIAFDSPDRFGKGLDWTGYTVHDAANILRRYFNQLPEPIIPLDFYDRFRNPIRNHQAQAVGSMEAQSPSVGDFDPDAAIREYQSLITSLPPLNRQLLLYILDLLAVFASKSDLNKMTTTNLAAIFQPGILSHPAHDMAPPEYRLSQDVLIFLIENQDSFLIGMQGTAADAETVRDVQSGTPSKVPTTPTTPGRSKTIIGRSSSNASTRAESTRKLGDVQRNVSGSSKLSKRSEKGPIAVGTGMSPTSSVHRSNTVPSRRDGSSAHSPRFSKEKVSEPSTPGAASPSIGIDTSKGRSESVQNTPVAATAPQFSAPAESTSAVSGEAAVAGAAAAGAATAAAAATAATVGNEGSFAISPATPTPKRDATPTSSPPAGSADQTADRSTSQTPATSPGRFLDIFKGSPSGEAEGRKPNKLQKKQRPPVSSLSSAQSSNQDLQNGGQTEGATSPLSPTAAPIVGTPDTTTVVEKSGEQSASAVAATQTTGQPTPAAVAAAAAAAAAAQATGQPSSTAPATTATPTTGTSLLPAPSDPARNLSATDNSLRPTISPSHSYHSGTESDADMVGDDLPTEQTTRAEKGKKRHRWRFSRTQNKIESSPVGSPSAAVGTLTEKEQTTSRSTVGSTGGAVGGATPAARQSFQEPAPLSTSATDPTTETPIQGHTFSSSSTDPVVFSDSEREKRGGGPMSWIREKMKEHKEKDAEKRARTPDRNRERSESRQSWQKSGGEAIPVRGKSFEKQRTDSEASVPPTTVTAPTSATTTTTTTTSSPAAASTAPATISEVVPETGDTKEEKEVEEGESAPAPVVPLSSDHNGQQSTG